MFLDILSSLAGLIVPPAFDFIKKKFLKPSVETPQATLSSLISTKPDVVAAYIEAQAKLIESEVKLFNKDVTQTVSLWVANLRASIRPVFTIISVIMMFAATMYNWNIDPSIKSLMEITIASWFGSRLI